MIRKIALILVLVSLAACSPSEGVDISGLPEGNVTRGEALFQETINGSPACSTCHNINDVKLVGPSFAGYGTIAETRVEGQSAAEYTYQSIVRPADHIVDGYGNLMYTQYQSKLSEQEIADLMAYLLAQ
jgi:cytochrome c553